MTKVQDFKTDLYHLLWENSEGIILNNALFYCMLKMLVCINKQNLFAILCI